MLSLTLLAFALSLAKAAAFVPSVVEVGTLPVRDAKYQRPASSLWSATTTTTTIEPPFEVLLEADPAVEAPLPPSFTECPFSGIMAGPKSFYRQASDALQAPQLFSFLHRDKPTVEVRGGKLVRDVLRQEFTSLSSNAVPGISQKVCGLKSLRTARDKDEHRALRQLVGVPLSPAAVAKSIPRLQAIGRARIREQLDRNDPEVIIAWDWCQAMALDVVWQQILGLDLETPQEIAVFHRETHTWLKGMWYKEGSPEMEATMKARIYLRAAIDKKISQLLQAGESDGSTVGGLVFATMDDVEDSSSSTHRNRTLLREEVIDNCLVLILAGTETTATNVANALLLMGLHSDKWQKVIEEQETIVGQHGDALTPEALKSCPYLEAVILEMMRILPVTLVSKRVTQETIVVDGTQIPKGWGVSYNLYLTHQQDASMEEGHMDFLNGFRPERWLQTETRPGKDYLPFGAGPRRCPGDVLAMTEMKTFLSLLAREMPRFELVDMEYDPNRPVDEQIQWNKVSSLMTPEDGVRIRVLPKETN